jgi:signal transduction histidine kinase
VEFAAEPIHGLPGPIETAAYFLVSEALTNVIKHATATSVTVTIAKVERRLAVEVSDNGSGGATIDSGSGLRGLSDRVAALDGRLQLHSSTRGGTRLRAELPCA